MRISIIIPALNEAATIAEALLSAQSDSVAEFILVDGGSHDKTAQLALDHGAKILTSPTGRAKQMNIGAAAATGDVLLFLHADTRLPEGFCDYIRQIMAQSGTVAGAFQLSIDAPHPALRFIERMANWRSRRLQIPYGDQALFLKADMFREMGGFADMPIMEDFELVLRLRKRGRIAIAPASVATSARRWTSIGIWRTTLINQASIVAYYSGVAPSRIARWYYRENHPASSIITNENSIRKIR